MKIHPLAQIIPPLTPDEIERLEESLKRGFDPMKPIVTLDGMILDGRHRAEIAERLGVEPTYAAWVPAWEGDTPADFVARSIIHRSLTATQRATIAAEMMEHIEAEAAKRVGGRPKGDQKPPQKIAEVSKSSRESAAVAAKATGTNREYVKVATKAKAESPATFEKMKAGTITMAEAAATIKAPPRPVKKGPPTPPEIEKAIAALPLFKAEINVLHACRRRVKALSLTEPGVELAAKAWKRIDAALSEAANDIRFKAPYCQCPLMPTCEVGCKQCRGRKWISMEVFRLLPPKLQEGIVPFASSPVLDTEGDSQ